jgi:hypothetical protein
MAGRTEHLTADNCYLVNPLKSVVSSIITDTKLWKQNSYKSGNSKRKSGTDFLLAGRNGMN